MEITFKFVRIFFYGLELASPLLLSLAVLITLLGQIDGFRESWGRFDSFYWAFITVTTVGYGDIRPVARLSRVLSVLIALTCIIFTGVIVALAINAATIAFSNLIEAADVKARVEELK